MDLVVTKLAFVHRESQVSQEAPDRRDQQVLWDHPALKESKAQEEIKVMMGNQVAQGPQIPWDLGGLAGPQGIKGGTGAKGEQGPPGPQGPPWTLRGNWKQCVFKNPGEGKDNGLIKVNTEFRGN